MPKNFGTDYKNDNINNIKDCMADVSWTDKTANVKYDGKPDTLIECHRYVVTDSEYDKELTIQASKSENNNTVTFTANGNGGSGDYTYKFIVYNKTTNQWAKLQDFSEKNTFTWTKGNAGDRYFYVDIKDNSTGEVVRSEALNVKMEATTKPLAISATKQEADKTVTFTAKGSGGSGKYSYKFIVYNKTTKQWAKLQDFSATSKLTWKAGSAGERQFYVDVKDKNGNTVRSSVMNVKTTK